MIYSVIYFVCHNKVLNCYHGQSFIYNEAAKRKLALNNHNWTDKILKELNEMRILIVLDFKDTF